MEDDGAEDEDANVVDEETLEGHSSWIGSVAILDVEGVFANN